MKKLEVIHRTIGLFIIILGMISYVFPVPGSTVLVAIGFVWLLGKKQSLKILRKILGNKIFKSLKIKDLIEEV